MAEARVNEMPDTNHVPVPPLGYLRCAECDGRYETMESLERHRRLHALDEIGDAAVILVERERSQTQLGGGEQRWEWVRETVTSEGRLSVSVFLGLLGRHVRDREVNGWELNHLEMRGTTAHVQWKVPS